MCACVCNVESMSLKLWRIHTKGLGAEREVLWCQPGQPGRVLAPQTWSGLVSGQSVIVKLETANS